MAAIVRLRPRRASRAKSATRGRAGCVPAGRATSACYRVMTSSVWMPCLPHRRQRRFGVPPRDRRTRRPCGKHTISKGILRPPGSREPHLTARSTLARSDGSWDLISGTAS
jgi:hypothetical protein